MTPDETTAWKLEYDDLFDREEPRSVDETGIGIIEGLVALWCKTLHEGVDEKGRRTFSAFALQWDRRYASVPIHPTEPNPTLAKLRAWVFPPLQEGTKPPADAWKDGCPTAPHARNDELLRRVARLHLHLVTSEEWDAFYEAAGRLLALCETLATADELLA
jgi:hypothetical protein